MFVAVWMLYAGDRLLDAKPLFTGPAIAHLEERHRFHHRHRARFLRAIVVACLFLVLLLHKTADAVLHLDILLAILLGAWLFLIHARSTPSGQQDRLPKEFAVGVFFSAAVFIPTVARVTGLRLALLSSAVCFAAICSLNCLFLYTWEHPHDRTYAHPTTRWAVRRLKPLALTFTLLTGAFYVALATLPAHIEPLWLTRIPHPAAVPLACTLAAALLLTLHAARHRLPPLTLRALADLALLTPLPILLAFTLKHP